MLFDRSRLTLSSLADRRHELDLSAILPLAPVAVTHPALHRVAAAIHQARQRKAAVVLMIGAHVLRSGVQRYLIDLMERGLLTLIAVNGACLVHDWELALIGATTESVADSIRDGRFGLWHETGRLNEIITAAAASPEAGAGGAVGQAIREQKLPHRGISLLAAAHCHGVPVTAHVGIGYDIVHELPNCDGGAWGTTSYRDFLRLVSELENLSSGVVMNFGSAVMGPEVFLKGLAMARNAAARDGRRIDDFTTLVCDLRPLPGHCTGNEAAKSDPNYYFRPWKTMLVRTVADGGESHYVQDAHARTIPQLWTALTAAEPNG